jgi:putative copper export protein
MRLIGVNYNERMLALRYAALLALAVWVGGLIALATVAAPALFDVLGSAGSSGRLQAATVFAEVLRRFDRIAYICSGLILASLAARAVLGPRPRRFAVRTSIAGLMLVATAWSGFVVAPRVAQIQREIGGLPSSLAPDDARRIEFVRLHRLATTLGLVPLVGGLALILWELKD